MALTFPYPVIDVNNRRPAGQGCQSCVHKGQCPALYWFRRYGEQQSPVEDAHMGTACTSWSSDTDDIPTGADNPEDTAIEQRMYDDGIGSEPNRNGITSPTTGKSN